MEMNEGNLIIRSLVSPSNESNVYLLINGDEAWLDCLDNLS